MGRLDMVKQYKLLGTWVNEEGDCKTNIKKRKQKGEGALKKINQMTQQNKVGKQEVPLKIDLYKTVFLATLLYNMEAWGRMTKDEMEDLESTQASTLKRLMKVPNTTSHPGVLNELGIWTVEYQLVYRRLMLYFFFENFQNFGPFLGQGATLVPKNFFFVFFDSELLNSKKK